MSSLPTWHHSDLDARRGPVPEPRLRRDRDGRRPDRPGRDLLRRRRRDRRTSTRRSRRISSGRTRARSRATGRRSTAIWGRSGIGAEARGASAIDIALWDLAGKRHGQPLCESLGGAARRTSPRTTPAADPTTVGRRPSPATGSSACPSRADGSRTCGAFQHEPEALAGQPARDGLPGHEDLALRRAGRPKRAARGSTDGTSSGGLSPSGGSARPTATGSRSRSSCTGDGTCRRP